MLQIGVESFECEKAVVPYRDNWEAEKRVMTDVTNLCAERENGDALVFWLLLKAGF